MIGSSATNAFCEDPHVQFRHGREHAIVEAEDLGYAVQVWTRVIFPAVLPQVFTMLRINFFAAWMAVLAAEMVGVKNGLGMMIILGREMFNTKLILLGMCMVGATGYLVDALLVQIQRRILWWQPAP